MIIDAHTHVEASLHTPKDLISSMDQAGIYYAMLIADSAPLGFEMTTDKVIKICEENPRLKANGVKLYPGYEDFYPLDEKLFPFYRECQKLGKPFIFHTGLLQAGVPGRLKQSHPLNIDDLENKFPELKIIMAHFGNPWIIDGTMVAWRNKNVYVDLSGYFEGKSIPKEHIKFFKQDLAYFRSFLGSFKKYLFATDWPLCSQKEYLNAVKQLNLTAEEKDLVFWKNAKEIFGLEI